jgi:hypothetical protein
MDLSGAINGHVEPLAFSSADFDDADAGSGTMVNTKQGIENALQYHMNVLNTIVPDERDFLRPWRKRLRDILLNESEMLTTFLEKPLEDTSIVQRHSHFIKSLELPSISSSSSWLKDKVADVVDKDKVLTELETQLGFSFTDIRNNIHKVMNTYLETVAEMFRSMEILNLKIEKVDSMKKRLLGISIEDGETEEILALKQSVVAYIRAEYERNKIQGDYTEFCTLYARFVSLRSILMALNVSTNNADGPICSICTTERVSWALVPCGHTFCNGCAQKQRHLCFVCRTTLRDRQRLYFI